MKSSHQFNLTSAFQIVGALVALTFAAGVSGCGKGDPSPTSSVQPALGGSAPVTDPLVGSVADQCGIETYVGPFRGYELPYINGAVWKKGFTYSSGLGDEVVSGYSAHSVGAGGLASVDPRCSDLKRVFTAAPISDDPAEVSDYNLSLNFSATAAPFPESLEEAKQTPSIQAKLTASLVVTVMKPCTHSYTESCWENIGESQSFPVEFHCGTSEVLKRTVPADQLTDQGGDKDYRDAYSLDFPDQCVFRLRDADLRLGDGRIVRASIAGSAAKEAEGARLRILRIALGQ